MSKASELTGAGVLAVLTYLLRRDEITAAQAEELRQLASSRVVNGVSDSTSVSATTSPAPAPATPVAGTTAVATSGVSGSATAKVSASGSATDAAYARIREDIVIAALDRAGLAADAGRVQARGVLRQDGIQVSNDALRAALRRRHEGNL
jgi:hypothetical protein